MSHGPRTIERALRASLSQPESDAQHAAGWDNSGVSRFLSGQQGVTISKIDGLVNACGYVLVSQRYFDAIGTLGEVGMHCQCDGFVDTALQLSLLIHRAATWHQ